MSKQFRQRVADIFEDIKQEIFRYQNNKIPILDQDGNIAAFFIPVTKSFSNNKSIIELLAKWRNENVAAYPSQFEAKFEGTKKWLDALISNPSRILFFIKLNEKNTDTIGHMGLFSFNFRDNTCEIDNVARVKKNAAKGMMTLALKSLIRWTYDQLKAKRIYLKVFKDNQHAIEYYERCGFKKCELIPLKKVEKPSMVLWCEDKKLKNAKKYFLKMLHTRN